MFRIPPTAIQKRNMNLLPSVLYVWSLLYSSCEVSDPCVKAENHKYFCTVIPPVSWYPPNVKLLLFKVESGIGSINVTVFNSSRLASVSNLTISNSGVTSIAPGAFNSLLGLVVLILNSNKLSTISASWFTNPASLVKLSLVRNRIRAIDVATLSNFSNLAELNLSQNVISTVADQSFRNNLKLSILDLSNNKLTFLRTETFADLHPQKLGLQDNPWICSCELADFATFLGGLVNKSVLDAEYSVTCHDPPNLQGTPVWNMSDFGCETSASTTWPNQHEASEKLLPKLLGLLGLLFVLLLLVLLLLKRKHEKKQIIPGRQTRNKHENDPQKEAPKEKSKTEVQVVNSVSGVDVNNKHTASVIAGVQQVNEIRPKDLPELTYCSQGISNISASTSQLFTEDWESVKNKGITSNQEKATCDDSPSSVVFENQSTGVLAYGTVGNSKALAMSSFQNQAGSDVTKWNRNGNGKPVGTIIPLPKMATDDNVNPDENLALTTTMVSRRHDVVRNSVAREQLNKEDASELYDSSISLMNSVTERQHGKESEMPEQNGSQANIVQVQMRVVDDGRRESRLKNDENSMKSSGVGNPTSLIKGDLSTTKRVKRGQISSEAIILPGSRRGSVTANNETAVNTSSTTKDDLPWGSDYGYINLLHEIVENQGRRTRERWKKSHRFKITHQV